MKDKKNLKKFPKHETDEDAANFLDAVDLTEYDFSEFKPVQFEFASKSARINMRLPESLLERIKQIAEEKHMPYTRFIRQVLEAVVAKEELSHN